MIKTLLFICALVGSLSIVSQVTLKVVSTPQLTPLLDTIYVAGNFNNWNPADPAYRLQLNGAGEWEINLNIPAGTALEYKFTRGFDWSTVEGTDLGGFIPNRTLIASNGQIAQHSIAGWEDIAGSHTVTQHVRILASHFSIPQLSRTRRIWVCLPSDYAQSQLSYPVLYMHDGQNLFDVATSFAGEWQIDETMLQRDASGCQGVIVVGIDNGGGQRMEEYSPWANAAYNVSGEGIQYSAFVSQTLKPFIDNYLRTASGPQNTIVGGSSLGALIACYIQARYPDIFGKSIQMSPAYWFNQPSLINYLSTLTNLPDYFQAKFCSGANESQSMITDVNLVINALEEVGVSANAMDFDIYSNGQHNESSWAAQFPEQLSFLIPCVSEVPENKTPLFQLYPNPGSDILHLVLADPNSTVCIRDQMGRIVVQEKQNNRSVAINMQAHTAGVYMVQVKTAITNQTLLWIKND